MIYVAIGQAAGEALARRATPVVVVDDNVLVGSASTLLERHRAKRARKVEIGGAITYDRNRPWINSVGAVTRAKADELRILACE